MNEDSRLPYDRSHYDKYMNKEMDKDIKRSKREEEV
jgi:hypothetical protein